MDKQELIEKYEKLIQQNEPELEESKLAESRSKLYNNILRELKRMDDGITTEQAWEKIAEEYKLPVETVQQIAGTTISSAVKKEDIAIRDGCIILNPNLTEPEQPEIPKFVADWIEEKRPYYSLMTMVGNYLNGFGMPERVEEWITDNKEDYLKALVIGYAIEKEPAWVVKINEKLYFCRFTDKYFEKDSDAPTYIESGNPSLIKKFTNKDKAEAVAILVDGEVEEWSE